MNRDELKLKLLELMKVEKELDEARKVYEKKDKIVNELANLIGLYNPVETDMGTFEAVMRKGKYTPVHPIDIKMKKLDPVIFGKKNNQVPAYTEEEAKEIIKQLNKISL